MPDAQAGTVCVPVPTCLPPSLSPASPLFQLEKVMGEAE